MKRMLFRRGFSDKLYYYNFRAVWLFTIACFILNALSGWMDIEDLAVINVGLPAAFAELGIHTGFIVWKAKAENSRKFSLGNEEESEEEL